MEGLLHAISAIAHAAHYAGIVVAGIAGFLVGWLWYAIFGRAWREALGDSVAKRSPGLYLLAFLATLVMAAMLQGVLVHSKLWGVKDGMISGTFLWIGFVLTSLGLSERFQGRPGRVIAIDLGHWLAVLLVMGAIIGAFGPA
jgi:hypothetical protein